MFGDLMKKRRPLNCLCWGRSELKFNEPIELFPHIQCISLQLDPPCHHHKFIDFPIASIRELGIRKILIIYEGMT
jgi:hypothetical protein